MQYSLFILEDDETQLHALKNQLASHFPNLSIVTATSYHEALQQINTNPMIDCFLLDIMLGDKDDKTGIQFAQFLRTKQQYQYSPIIFLTVISDQILTAINLLHCYSYIEKPYSINDILSSVTGALNYSTNRPAVKTQLMIKDIFGISHRLEISTILFINTTGYHQSIFLQDMRIISVAHKSLSLLRKQLGNDFIQCNRSYLININAITSLNSTYSYVSIQDKRIPIGRSYQKKLYERLRAL